MASRAVSKSHHVAGSVLDAFCVGLNAQYGTFVRRPSRNSARAPTKRCSGGTPAAIRSSKLTAILVILESEVRPSWSREFKDFATRYQPLQGVHAIVPFPPGRHPPHHSFLGEWSFCESPENATFVSFRCPFSQWHRSTPGISGHRMSACTRVHLVPNA